MEKTIGQLIDDLSISNIRIWHLQDIVSAEKDDTIVAQAAKQIITENTFRCKLVKEIDKFFGVVDKSYSTEKTFK
ncbi:unnamed protein product [marine sediment metagenome]|uniref:Uncharacterized protein n=1 Tax=marine sediment metagenome TaxID=412755 RepID=X0XQV0_9ZZZZ